MKKSELSKLLKLEDCSDEIAETPIASAPSTKVSSKRFCRILEDVQYKSPSSSDGRVVSNTSGPKTLRRDSVLCPATVQKKPLHRDPGKSDLETARDSFGRRLSSLQKNFHGSPMTYGTPKHLPGGISKSGRTSLARAVNLRNVNADGLKCFDTPKSKTPLSVRDLAESSPGIFIPSIQELDVTGTELAEDMAGNLVAGIFSMSDSEPQLLQPIIDKSVSLRKISLGRESPQNSPDSIEDECCEGIRTSGYLKINDTTASLVLRFPDCCLYAKGSNSKKYIAMLIGDPIQREPREIVILSTGRLERGDLNEGFGLKIVQIISVQKSVKFFPRSIPYNVNFFSINETKRGDPVLLLSAALELTDFAPQLDLPALQVIPCGRRISFSNVVTVETELPIIFLENHSDGSNNSIVVSGAFAEDGARVMTFDPMWQSFTWGREYSSCTNSLSSALTTHVSKLVSIQGSLKAVLASDCSSSDVVYSWETPQENSHLQCIDNAELFMDGNSWKWFMNHQHSIKDLSFAGKESLAIEAKDNEREPRALTVIFASESYVAIGDVHGMVQVWDMKNMQSKRFSICDTQEINDTRISAIIETKFGDRGAALFITCVSGTCILISCEELFSVSIK